MKKNFLFISPWINPFEPHYGGAQRSYLLLRALLECGNVDVVVFRDEDEVGIDKFMNGCEVIHLQPVQSSRPVSRAKKWFGLLTPWNPYSLFPVNPDMEKLIDDIVNKKQYDAIVIRYLPQSLSLGLLKYANRLIIDIDDHPKDVFNNKARQVQNRFNRVYCRIVSILSPITVKHVANIIKAAFFSNPQQVVGRNGFFLPNVSLEEPKTEYVSFEHTSPRLFFVGKLDYSPNYLGVDWFIINVWRMIKEVIKDAEFHIAGKVDENAKHVVAPYLEKWAAIDGVSVLGFVEDINKEYEECRATVSPIFSGAGTNIKLLESMQRKRVCITTSCGIRGAESFFCHGKEVLVASNATEYAEFCIRALTDEGYNKQIARNANSVMERHFSHKSYNNIVKNVINN